MNWKDIDVDKIRMMILHCYSCGRITEATKSNGFKCEYCNNFTLTLNPSTYKTSSKSNERPWELDSYFGENSPTAQLDTNKTKTPDLHVKSTAQNNPAHYCMGLGCKEFLGHRGFCSTKCHNSHYDDLDSKNENGR